MFECSQTETDDWVQISQNVNSNEHMRISFFNGFILISHMRYIKNPKKLRNPFANTVTVDIWNVSTEIVYNRNV